MYLKLDQSNKIKCEGIITEHELTHVLKNMKNGKSPGSDGFLAEFYKIFWKEFRSLVCKSLNEAFEKG